MVRQNLVSIVSGTGQIKPKTYVNIGATSFGRITHLYVKEGDHVKQGQILATVESVQPKASVAAQEASIRSADTDIIFLPRRGEDSRSEQSPTPKPTSSRSSWTWHAPRPSTRQSSSPSRTTTPRRQPTT